MKEKHIRSNAFVRTPPGGGGEGRAYMAERLANQQAIK